MVHIEFDPSPIEVATYYTHSPDGSKSWVEVYIYDLLIWKSEPQNKWGSPDEDEVKAEWDGYFQKFQAEQFKEWLKTNGPK